MSNPYNGSKHGKRGGNFRPSRLMDHTPEIDDRPSALRKGSPLRPAMPTDSTIIANTQAKYWSCTAMEETQETHLIPRESITKRQHLELFAPKVELATVVTRQLDRVTGKVIETTDNRVVWRSDRNLLRRGKPEQLEDVTSALRRQTSRSKRIDYDQTERPAVVEVEQPIELDTTIV